MVQKGKGGPLRISHELFRGVKQSADKEAWIGAFSVDPSIQFKAVEDLNPYVVQQLFERITPEVGHGSRRCANI